jgi:Cu-Zn family superoxide dismutase
MSYEVSKKELHMTRRVIALAATGWFGAALFAANKPVTLTLNDGTGKDVGTAKISDGSGGKGVRIELNLKGFPPGEHALHVHTTAKCEGPAFTSAGGHFSRFGKLNANWQANQPP